VSAERVAELSANLAAVRARIAAACAPVDRDPDSVTLIAVTKTRPAADVVALAGLGVTDVGENRDSDAAAKAAEVAAMTGAAAVGPALRWHMIGQLQSNKVRSVVGWAHAVHSVDRERLVHSLERAATGAGRVLDCFVQVDLRDPAAAAADPGRGGAAVALVPALADAVAGCTGLRLRGLMAVAPVDGDPAAAFAVLARLAEAVRRQHPSADALSAGMSGDLEAAVAAGATHVRVGSALLGSRPPLH
jgi:pyridoxal phosphate enzyme (YggS family)